MGAVQTMDRRADLAIAPFVALGLLLLIAAGTSGLQWISTRWDATCHRLLHAPRPPTLVQPWRLTTAAPDIRRPPRLP